METGSARPGKPAPDRHDEGAAPSEAAVPVLRAPRVTSGRERSFRPDIEGLRAVAVLLVVLNHVGFGVPGGFVGVDVFFVISGFLITGQLLRERARSGRISFREFYARRARRILPAALVVVAVSLLASWAWLSPLRLRDVAHDAIFATFSAINFKLARDRIDYFHANDAPSVFQHYWSLAVEEQFYLVWPAMLAIVTIAASLVARRFRRGPRSPDGHGQAQARAMDRPVVIALLVVAVMSFVVSVIVTADSAPWAYFGAHTRAWEFAVGGLVAVAPTMFGRMRPVAASALTWLGVAGIVLAAFVLNDRTPFPGAAALLPVLATGCVVAGGCAAPARGAELLLGRAPVRAIGRISYSWYLWHWPVLQVWPEATGKRFTGGQQVMAIGLSLVLAVLTYRFVENPARAWRALRGHPLVSLGLGAGFMGVVCEAALLVASAAVVPGSASSGPPKPLVGATRTPSAAELAEKARADELTRQSAEPRFLGVARTELTPIIEASLHNDQLPTDLTPSLTDAVNDFSVNHCFLWFKDTVPTECVGGDPTGSTTVVLFGDSHANEWYAALDAIGKERHWRIIPYTKADCPPAPYPNYFEPSLSRTYSECDTWRATVLWKIATLRPEMVVVASVTRDDVAQQSPEVMAGLVRGLRTTGAKVVFMRDTPFPAMNVSDCLSKHPTKTSRCALSPDKAKLTSPAREIENRGARDGGATLVDPVGWLCVTDGCPLVIGNTLVYSDFSHVSSTYTKLLAPYLGPDLAAILHTAGTQGTAPRGAAPPAGAQAAASPHD